MRLILVLPAGIEDVSALLARAHFASPQIIVIGMDHPKKDRLSSEKIMEKLIKMFSKPINLEPRVIEYGPELAKLCHSDLIQKIHERRNSGRIFFKKRKYYAFRKV